MDNQKNTKPEQFKNVGELLGVTQDELIPFLNQKIVDLSFELAQAKAANKHLVEEYSKLHTTYLKSINKKQKGKK